MVSTPNAWLRGLVTTATARRVAILVLLTVTATSSNPNTYTPAAAESLDATVRDLRLRARYADAVIAATARVELERGRPEVSRFDIEELEWRVRSLERMAALPDSLRHELSKVDSLGTRLVESVAVNVAGGAELGETWLAELEAILGPDCREVANAHAQVGGYQYFEGNFVEAERHFRRSLEILRRSSSEDDPVIARCMSDIAVPLVLQGALAEAESLLRGSLDRLLRAYGMESTYVLNAMNNLAAVLERQGDDVGAEELTRSIIEIQRTAGTRLGLPLVNPGQHNRLARILRRRGALSDAEAELRTSIRAHADPGYANPSYDLSVAYHVLGGVLADRGDYPGAIAAHTEALRICRQMKGSEHADVAGYLASLAETYLGQGAFAKADSLLRIAVSINDRRIGLRNPLTSRSLRLLGLTREALGRPAEAESLLLASANAFDAARLGGTIDRRATFPLVSPYPDLARVRITRGRPRAAWDAAERGLSRALLDLLVASDIRQRSPGDIAEEDSLSLALNRLERRMDEDRAPDLRSKLLRTEAAWIELRRRQERQRPLSGADAYPLERIQSCLTPGRALVGWIEGNPFEPTCPGWGYVVHDHGSVAWSPLGERAKQIDDAALTFRRTVDAAAAWPLLVPLTDEMLGQAVAVWERYVAPLESDLAAVDHVCVVSPGPLLGVPLEAARSPDGRWGMDRFTVSYTPSATVYAWLIEREGTRKVPRERDLSALLVGDPTEPSGMPTLPSLPGGRDEIARIATLFSTCEVLTGVDASEARLVELATTRRLQAFDVIHFATHAVIDDHAPERSTLLLSAGVPSPFVMTSEDDGQVRNRDILRLWHLDADLVTLSGCRTGTGKATAGEGFVGLAHTFFQVGARSLLVSLWPVEDQATSILMTRFYERLNAGGRGDRVSKEEALRSSRRDLRDFRAADGSHPYAHPAYWSAFVIMGDAR